MTPTIIPMGIIRFAQFVGLAGMIGVGSGAAGAGGSSMIEIVKLCVNLRQKIRHQNLLM